MAQGSSSTEVPHYVHKIDKITDFFTIGAELGRGGNAVVYSCVEIATGTSYALKVIDRAVVTLEDASQGELLKQVNHTNIIFLKDVLQTPSHLYLVLELATGKELFDRIIAAKKFSEKDAAKCIYKVVSALKHLHTRGIAHCDLKPENLLYASPDPDAEIKVADFGFAAWTGRSHFLRRICGTPQYVAPEILRRKAYGVEVDMWSLGVILYILLVGYPPFGADQKLPKQEQNRQLQDKIMRAAYRFHKPYWDRISDGAKSLVTRLLQVDPEKRLTADDVMSDAWVVAEAPDYHLEHMMDHMVRFNNMRTNRIGSHPIGALYMKESGRSGNSMDDAAHMAADLAQGKASAEHLKEGGIHPIVSLLWSTDEKEQKEAAYALANLARREDIRTAIMEEGGLKALVEVSKLSNKTDVLSHIALTMYYCIESDVGHQDVFVQAGGLESLNKMIGGTSSVVRNAAVRVLAKLVENPSIKSKVVQFSGFQPFITVAVSDQQSLRQDATVALIELCTEPTWGRGIVEALADMIKQQNAEPGLVAQCFADMSTLPQTQRVLVQSGLTKALQPVWAGSNDMTELRHVVNALGNCAYEIKAANDALLGEILAFLNAQTTAATDDAALQFCCQWALQNFTSLPNLPQGVVLDKKLPYLKLLPDHLQARNDTYSFQSATAMAAVDRGRWQFEVALLTDGHIHGHTHIGWARSDSTLIDGVGCRPRAEAEPSDSFGYDATLMHAWTDGKYAKYGTSRAKVNSVVGCYVDLDSGSIGYQLDGVDLGEAFSIPPEQRQAPLAYMSPALSLGRFQQCAVNFGATPFRFPLPGFSPISTAPRQPL